MPLFLADTSCRTRLIQLAPSVCDKGDYIFYFDFGNHFALAIKMCSVNFSAFIHRSPYIHLGPTNKSYIQILVFPKSYIFDQQNSKLIFLNTNGYSL